MASVVAIVPSICLSLTKTVFRNALSAESFSKVLSTVLDERKKARKRRQSASRQKMLLAASGSMMMSNMIIQHISSHYVIRN
jgi:CRP-like cAMP-binding protein